MKNTPLIVAAMLLIGSASVFAASPTRTNVLMIAIDDLRPELGCYGVDEIRSPHIDRLAADGVRFDRAYCQVAVCGASRGSLLSGCRPETTTIWDYKTPLRSVMPDVLTLPGHFKAAGYQTATLGKVYHAANDDAESFTVDVKKLAPQTKGLGRGWVKTPYGKRKDVGSIKMKLGPSTENGGSVADNMYKDGENAERAVKVLEHFADQDEPFFFAVGFSKPHLPFVAPSKYWDMYDPEKIVIPPKTPMKNSPAWAGSGWGELKNYPDIDPKMDPLDDETSRRLIHGYRAAVSFADAQVGKLLDALKQTGLDKNTVVVLWGDHGWYVGDFGDWCKHSNYEIATRVPMIVRVPPARRQATGSSDALVELVDIYPTLCDLTGTTVPEHLHGHSFASLLSQPDQPWKEAAFSQYVKSAPKEGRRGRTPQLGTSIRTDRFRYTRWVDRQDGSVTTEELVDFESDPKALKNVASEEQYADDLPRLRELAAQSATGIAPPQLATSN